MIYNKAAITIEAISIHSNSSHLEQRRELSDSILKGTHRRTIPARFGSVVSDLNVKVYIMYDGLQVMAKAHMAFGQEIKIAHLGVKQPSKQEVWHFKI